jgi:hypothetical protein
VIRGFLGKLPVDLTFFTTETFQVGVVREVRQMSKTAFQKLSMVFFLLFFVSIPLGVAGCGGGSDNGGSSGSCSKNETSCGSECINLNTDVDNCGKCGVSCNENDAGLSDLNEVASCSLGKCNVACKRGYYDCNNDARDGCESDTACNEIETKCDDGIDNDDDGRTDCDDVDCKDADACADAGKIDAGATDAKVTDAKVGDAADASDEDASDADL